MKNLWKKILVLVLGFSNLAVLGLVFHIYFDSHQKLLLFSTSEDETDLRNKLQRTCGDLLQELIDGERESFICNVKVKPKHKGASYTLRTRIRVKKGEEGFEIEGRGQMREPTQHATQADFCNDCAQQDKLAGNSFQEFMDQVMEMGENIYSTAQNSVIQAHEEYNKKDLERRMADLKEQDCEGAWNEELEKFEEFDREERLNCQLSKISKLDLPLDIENFYHRNLKKELWKTALSEEGYILDEDMLGQFDNPYRYSFSVRTSTGLIRKYLDWKEDYALLRARIDKENFARSVKAELDQVKHLMTRDQFQQDFYYLNQGFEGQLARLNQSVKSLPNPSPSVGSVNSYEDVSRQVEDLY